MKSDLDISFVEITQLIWKSKWVVVATAATACLVSVAYAMVAQPIYRSEAVLVQTEYDEGSQVPGGLSGLAGLAGIQVQSSANRQERIALLESRSMIEAFIQEKNLLPVLFEDQWDSESGQWLTDDSQEHPDIDDAVERFRNSIRTITHDAGTGVIRLGIEWSDPAISQRWAADFVSVANEVLRQRDMARSERRLSFLSEQMRDANLVEIRQGIARLVQSEIQTLTLARSESEYGFTVVDPPRKTKIPIWPKKKLIVFIATMFGGVFGAIGVLMASLAPAFGNTSKT